MKKIFFNLLFLFFIFLASVSFIQASEVNMNYHPDQLLIKFKKNITQKNKSDFYKQSDAEEIGSIDKLDIQIIKPRKDKIPDFIEKHKKNNYVEFIEPDYKAYALEMSNDSALVNNLQQNLIKIHSADINDSAWNYSKSNANVKITILDTGIDQNHEDLAGKIVINHNCSDSSTVDDLYGHGTHVAGVAAAMTNNGSGVAGVGYNASLVNAKALGDNGSGYYSWVINCITWASDQSVQVINMSLGGSSSSVSLQNAINYAWNKGVVLVAASGNSGTTTPSYPANYANVVSVSAVDLNDQKPSWSNYGTWVDVAAPGVSIYSSLPNHPNSLRILNYGTLSGTSMASPHVAGLAALLSSMPNMDNKKVVNYIENFADRITGTGTYWNYGRINALKSVTAALSVTIPTTIPSPSVTLTPTSFVQPTNTPRPTPTPIPSTRLTPTPWYCRYFPSRCT